MCGAPAAKHEVVAHGELHAHREHGAGHEPETLPRRGLELLGRRTRDHERRGAQHPWEFAELDSCLRGTAVHPFSVTER